MKTKKQIEEQLKCVADLCWLHTSYLPERIRAMGGRDATLDDADIEAGMIINRHKIERQYNVTVPDDTDKLIYEFVRLSDELATLRWVLDNNAKWREAGLEDL